nr:DNA-directed DNA polymerase [Tanacetum cinerariifolium]
MMWKFLLKYFPPSMVTKLRNKIMKFRQDTNESLFEAWERYKLSIDRCPNHNMLLVTHIDMFYNGLTLRHRDTINAAAGGTFMQKTPEECYELIENMTAHHNHWDTSATQDKTSRTIYSTTTESPEVVRQLRMMNKNFLDMMRQIQSVKSVNTKCETCGGPHYFTKCPAVGGYTQEAAYATTSNHNSRGNSYQLQANPRGNLKAITTQSGVSYDGPTIPPNPSPLLKEVERETEATKDKVQATSSKSTTHIQPLVVQVPILEPKVAPKPNTKPSIPYPLRLYDQKLQLEECLALANLGASINLMPLSVWKKLSFPELTPTRMTIELVNQLVAYLVGVAKDVFVETFLEDNTSINRYELSTLNDDFDPEGDIALIEKLLNEDPSSNLPSMKNEDFKQANVTMTKPSIKEPLELKLKDLPSHLEYAFLEGTNKLPVIISKELKDEEKASLLNVLKSYRRAISWKLSDIKGIDPCFCTYKILIEDDFKPAVQHQRRAKPKIHEIIKNEVIKLLDARSIFPIFDSPWVSPVHCVPKNSRMIVVENKDNELIPTSLVT